MKKIISYLFVAVFAVLFSANAFALSLIYEDAFACRDDPAPEVLAGLPHTPNTISTSVGITSEFKVKQDLGSGLFIFELVGGLPRIIDGDPNVCIESDSAIGYESPAGRIVPRDSGSIIGLAERVFSIEAMGYFDGKQLVININAITSSASPQVDAVGLVLGSRIEPNSFILIFEFDPVKTSFKLKKYMRNTGMIIVNSGHQSASRVEPDVYLENIFLNRSRTMTTPIPDIEYRIVE